MPASSSHEFGSHGPPGKHGVFVRLQQAADEPDQFLVALVVVGRGGMRRRRGRGRGVEAGAAARLQIAHRDQAVVSLDHREAADIVAFGKVADRRQLGAWPQMPIVDLPLDAGHDLVGERLAAVLADGQGEHAGSRFSSDWPGRLDRYSYAN